MTTPTIGSLFAGYGGLDLATEAACAARTAWVSEIDPGACKVLAHRFPHAPNLGDVSVIEWTPDRAVDIITAGFPCQDVSTAGVRAGLAAGKRSGLWVEVIRAARELQPTFIALENVRGLLSAEGELPSDDLLALGDDAQRLDRILRLIESKKQRAIREGSLFHVRQHSTDFIRLAGRRDRTLAQYRAGRARLERAMGVVLRDLADLGYDAEWRGLRASDVGACHQRFRVFVLAWRRDAIFDDSRGRRGHEAVKHDGRGAQAAHRAGVPHQPDRDALQAGPDGGLTLLPTPRATDGTKGGPNQRGSSGDLMLPSAVMQMLPTPSVADTQGGRKHRSGARNSELLLNGIAHHEQFGQYAAAIARHERMIGRPAPSPVEPGRNGKPRLSAEFTSWMMGLPAGWIADVPDVTRNEALRMAGNGVIPQQALAALLDMLPHAIEALTGRAAA